LQCGQVRVDREIAPRHFAQILATLLNRSEGEGTGMSAKLNTQRSESDMDESEENTRLELMATSESWRPRYIVIGPPATY